MNIQFASGQLFFFTPTGTPVQAGALQDVSLDFSATVKDLFGQYQFPVASRRGTAKITGKAKFADINPIAWGELFFNDTPTTGQQVLETNGAYTVGSSTHTVQVTNHSTFVADYGVVAAATGIPFMKGSAPALNTYTVTSSTGTYYFASSAASEQVLVSDSYTKSGGHTITITNQLIGTNPVFQVALQQIDPSGNIFSAQFYQAMSNKLSMATKLEDYNIPEFDFSVFANAANQIGKLSFPT